MPTLPAPVEAAAALLIEQGHDIDRELAERLVLTRDDELPQLIGLAHQVRLRWMGPAVEVESIISAKTGGCPEDCTFCSQSARYTTDVTRQPMLATAQLVEPARPTRALRHAEVEIEVDASLGLLSDGQAEQLAAAGIHRYNHNLEAGPRFFPRICSTHTFADRVATCHRVIAAGMELCSGGIFGMGETWSDRLDLAFALRDLGTREIPCNFLDPRAGTPLGGETPLRPLDALRCTAMMRLVNPRAVVRYAGGRELVLRDLQAYGMLAGANGLIVGNYLTTLGRSAELDIAMLADLGMPVASRPLTGTRGQPPAAPAPPPPPSSPHT